MAIKKKNFNLTFEAPGRDVVYKNVRITNLPKDKIESRFLHVNVNRGQTIIVNGLGIDIGTDGLDMKFNREGAYPILVIGELEISISKFTFLKNVLKAAYHYDELPDGTWRLAMSENVVPGEHTQITKIILKQVD